MRLEKYKYHMAEIAGRARTDVAYFHKVCRFTVATIGVQFSTVPTRLERMHAGDWGGIRNATHVRRSTEYLAANHRDLWARLLKAEDAVQALDILTEVPGLGTVKAGFVAQMLGFDVGCMDTHNLRRFGLNPAAFSVTGVKGAETRRAKLLHYVDVCRRYGGSAVLWASWCELIAEKYRNWEDGEAVSAFHMECIGNA